MPGLYKFCTETRYFDCIGHKAASESPSNTFTNCYIHITSNKNISHASPTAASPSWCCSHSSNHTSSGCRRTPQGLSFSRGQPLRFVSRLHHAKTQGAFIQGMHFAIGCALTSGPPIPPIRSDFFKCSCFPSVIKFLSSFSKRY